MPRTIVLNTLAYKQVIKDNPSLTQVDLLHEIKSVGFQIVEIRREYIKAGEVELEKIAEKAMEEGLTLFYSVPDELFKKNEINPALKVYLKEAKLLNSTQMKLTLGELDNLTKQHAVELDELLQSSSIKLLIENDQTKEKGSATKLKTFMEQAAEFGLSLGLTFDIGNFVYINENPEESAKILKPFVQYIHIKNVKKTEMGIELTDIESGDINIQAVLNEFLESIPCAIEYPCGGPNDIRHKIEHEKNQISDEHK
jgi:sugar phosphate isomerase/epimerase